MKVSLARRTEQEWRCKSRRVRTHHSTSRVAVRRLGRIIQRIFLPNQEPALVEPFGNGLVRVGSQGLFSPYLWTYGASFLYPIYFLSPQLTAPGSPRMELVLSWHKIQIQSNDRHRPRLTKILTKSDHFKKTFLIFAVYDHGIAICDPEDWKKVKSFGTLCRGHAVSHQH